MSCDALFQLGMGSAWLDATQTEETPSLRAASRRTKAVCARDERADAPAAFAPVVRWLIVRLLKATEKQRGNSAKARIHRNIPR
jgi:hypothetical protein